MTFSETRQTLQERLETALGALEEAIAERDRLIDAGNQMATEVEERWSGPGGCDCPVCSAAKAWREVVL